MVHQRFFRVLASINACILNDTADVAKITAILVATETALFVTLFTSLIALRNFS